MKPRDATNSKYYISTKLLTQEHLGMKHEMIKTRRSGNVLDFMTYGVST